MRCTEITSGVVCVPLVIAGGLALSDQPADAYQRNHQQHDDDQRREDPDQDPQASALLRGESQRSAGELVEGLAHAPRL